MAWNANEKGNPAWLTKQASEHGGVDNFINDIYNKGYNDCCKHDLIYLTTVKITKLTVVGAYE